MITRPIIVRMLVWNVLAAVGMMPAYGACPKLLMMPSYNVLSLGSNAAEAKYWGKTVGAQGFFVSGIMGSWQVSPGANSSSPTWQEAQKLEATYAPYGVTDNFVMANIVSEDWSNKAQTTAAITNLGEAAALAKYAGFNGVALNLESPQPTWNDGQPDQTQLAATIKKAGAAIGQAMLDAYPQMTLIVLPDVLSQTGWLVLNNPATTQAERKAIENGAGYKEYMLAPSFLFGLLSVPWAQVVIATERTYVHNSIAPAVATATAAYAQFDEQSGEAPQQISIAPGLWPLGRSARDDSPNESAHHFAGRLRDAYASAQDYVWIFSLGTAWQANGIYAARQNSDARVVSDFRDYTAAVQQACP